MVVTKKRKTIFVEPEKRKALCKALGISKVTFYNAVNDVTNARQLLKIMAAFLSAKMLSCGNNALQSKR